MAESFNIKIAKYLAIHKPIENPKAEYSIWDLARDRNLDRSKTRRIDRGIRNFISVGFYGTHPLRHNGQTAVRKTANNRTFYHGEGFVTGLMEHPGRINYMQTIELLHYLEKSVHATPGSTKGDSTLLDELETTVDKFGLDDSNAPYFYEALQQGDYRDLWFERYGGPKPKTLEASPPKIKWTRLKVYPLIAAFLFATTAIAASRTYQIGLSEFFLVLDGTGAGGLTEYAGTHKRGPWLWQKALDLLSSDRPKDALRLLDVAEQEPLRELEKARASFLRAQATQWLGDFDAMQDHLTKATAHILAFEQTEPGAITDHKVAIERSIIAMEQGRHALWTGSPEKALMFFAEGLRQEKKININVPPEYIYHNYMHTILERLSSLAEAAQGQHDKAYWRMIRVIESGQPDFNPALTRASAFYFAAAANIENAEMCIGTTLKSLVDDPSTTQNAHYYLLLKTFVSDGRSTSPFLSYLDDQPGALDLALVLEAGKFQ